MERAVGVVVDTERLCMVPKSVPALTTGRWEATRLRATDLPTLGDWRVTKADAEPKSAMLTATAGIFIVPKGPRKSHRHKMMPAE